MAAVFFCFYSYSYSEVTNITSRNAAVGLNWSMQNVIPSITGLTVDGVIYQYSATKNTQDPMTVTIQNKNALGAGYVFRNQDDWTGLRGSTITKVIPIDNIPGNRWGDGEISIRGKGSVSDTSVFYKYRYDTCVNPLSSPSCPGYAEAMLKSLALKDVEVTDALTEEMKRHATENKSICLHYEHLCISPDEKKREGERVKQKKDANIRKDIVNSWMGLLSLRDIEVASQFEKMNNIPGFNLYSYSIPGGVYKDALRYPDKILPDNRRARSLSASQERMHEAMVDSQYNR